MTGVRAGARVVLVALAAACGDSGSSASATTTATSTTVEPEPCPGLEACESVQDCCDTDCPTKYPQKWSCINDKCVHACELDRDCSDLIPGLACIQVDGVGHCVTPCEGTPDCQSMHMEMTSCQAVGDTGAKLCIGSVAS